MGTVTPWSSFLSRSPAVPAFRPFSAAIRMISDISSVSYSVEKVSSEPKCDKSPEALLPGDMWKVYRAVRRDEDNSFGRNFGDFGRDFIESRQRGGNLVFLPFPDGGNRKRRMRQYIRADN
jgi:hypothetical protein